MEQSKKSSLTSSNGPHNSTLELIKEARAFSHSNIDIAHLEKLKLRGGETRNKGMIQSNLSEITVANVMGETLFKNKGNSMVKIERFKKLEKERDLSKGKKRSVLTTMTESTMVKV